MRVFIANVKCSLVLTESHVAEMAKPKGELVTTACWSSEHHISPESRALAIGIPRRMSTLPSLLNVRSGETL